MGSFIFLSGHNLKSMTTRPQKKEPGGIPTHLTLRLCPQGWYCEEKGACYEVVLTLKVLH